MPASPKPKHTGATDGLFFTMNKKPIIKKFGVDFHSEGGALTLPVEAVSVNQHVESGRHTRFHKGSGWTISGKVNEDYYTWVNEFEARHREHGRVWGNFEHEVFADSEAGFRHFMENHPPNAWDYWDI